MADLSKHKVAQAQEADKLRVKGEKLGSRALASSTLQFARLAVERAAGTKTRVALDEGAADMTDVRSDPRFNKALNQDLEVSQNDTEALMLEAMGRGLDSEMTWQATQFKGMAWKLTEDDTSKLPLYPIQGHTAAEISKYMHQQFRYEITGLTGAPMDGSTEIGSLPELLGAALQKFSDRVGGAVDEAYYAGIQLGAKTAAEAVTSAR